MPRVFEKVYNSAEQKAEADGKGKIFDAAADTAIAYSEALDDGGPGLGAQGSSTPSSTGSSTASCAPRSAAGSSYAISGGAPLGERLGHFFRGIGVTDPRGLRPDRDHGRPSPSTARTRCRIGTVGQPLPGVAIRIADDGEVLVKGGHVFRGYWNNDAGHRRGARATAGSAPATSASSTTTASCAITGRKKEIIVTAGGKNVAPAVLEDRLRAHRAGQPVHGRRRRQAVHRRLVTLDAEALPAWLKSARQGRRGRRRRPAADDADALAEIQDAVDDANKAVSKAEAIKTLRDPADRLHRGERRADAVAEAEAQRRDEGLRSDEVEALYS